MILVEGGMGRLLRTVQLFGTRSKMFFNLYRANCWAGGSLQTCIRMDNVSVKDFAKRLDVIDMNLMTLDTLIQCMRIRDIITDM